MIPVWCMVSHDPANGRYGDCVRACVASILELGSPDVPHFYDHGSDGDKAFQRLREFLAPLGYQPFFAHYAGEPLSDLLATQAELHPDLHYVLFGSTERGDHAVVCKGGAVVHNPDWSGFPIVKPTALGIWTVIVIAKS